MTDSRTPYKNFFKQISLSLAERSADASTGPATWERVNSTWQLIEMHAKRLGYNVLDAECLVGDASTYDLLQNAVEKMVALLYRAEHEFGSDVYSASLFDVTELTAADEVYGSSWMARGGVGAFFVTVRKYDRIANSIKSIPEQDLQRWLGSVYKIPGEGPWNDLRDLRKYLILWLSERLAIVNDGILSFR